MLVLDGQPRVCSLAFAAEGTRLVVVRDYERVEVWSPFGGELLYTLGPFYESTLTGRGSATVAVPARGPFLFVASRAAPLSYSVADGRHVGTAPTSAPIRHMQASPDGRWLVACDDATHNPRLYGFHCTPEGQLQSVWEEIVPHYETPTVFVRGARVVTRSGQRRIVRDAPTGKVQRDFPLPVYGLADDGASPDGKLFAIGTSSMYLWDTAGWTWGEPRRIEAEGGKTFTWFAFHPTRPLVATIQQGQGQVKFLDTTSGKPVAKFRWKLGPLRCVAFSADGTLAAVGTESGKIVVWDVDE